METDREELTALGFSVFVAAQLLPSAGDHVPDDVLLHAWLPKAGNHDHKNPLPLGSLLSLGWTIRLGASHVFGSPHGQVLFPPPSADGRWRLSGMRILSTDTLDCWVPYLIVAWLLIYASGAVGLWASLAWHGLSSAGLVTGITTLAETWAVGMALVVVITHAPMVALSLLARVPPHHPDLALLAQPEGYSLAGLWLYAGCSIFMLTSFLSLTWLVATLERWPDFEFPYGRLDPPSVPPHRTRFVDGVVGLLIPTIGFFTAAGVSQAMHMWRNGLLNARCISRQHTLLLSEPGAASERGSATGQGATAATFRAELSAPQLTALAHRYGDWPATPARELL